MDEERKKELVAKAAQTMQDVEDARIKRLENVVVCDPCKLLEDEAYEEYVAGACDTNDRYHRYKLFGRTRFYTETRDYFAFIVCVGGDGVFELTKKTKVSVDSGVIGMFAPKDDWVDIIDFRDALYGAHAVDGLVGNTRRCYKALWNIANEVIGGQMRELDAAKKELAAGD